MCSPAPSRATGRWRARTARASTFGTALDAIGYRGAESCGQHPLSAFFELHIEQGPILEAEEKEVGIVTGVQGMRWYEVTVTGESAHTGATPMRLRKNALLGAARLVERINPIAERHKPDALGAVGLMEVRPNSRNVVPGEVFFCVDLRHPDAAVLDQLETAYNASLRKSAIRSASRFRRRASGTSRRCASTPVASHR